ncbi:GntR family transcriptional regulator [Lacrimispora sp.]|uniref:GntR family transcriptional regulator n=1 Tax=Lacrimispora sp. TaxID=2719234 RepID=UPI0028A10C74|nr:GntR family transcriptional regulator [Lacrimispora sp.]
MKNDARHTGETAKEYAYRILKENIITLELEPGSTLNDMEISQMIGISRTPVREAIIKLKEESDIIEIFPQRGMRIALIDTDVVQEARFLRMILEKAMVELACDMAQEKDFVWLEENLTLQEFYLKNDMVSKLLELDNELHRKLFVICRKEQIYRVNRGLSIHYDRVRNMEAGTAIHGAKTVEDHRSLVEAIRDKDKERAKQIMEVHLDRWLLNEQTLRKEYPQFFKN